MKSFANVFICLLFFASSSAADVTVKFDFENAAGAIFHTEDRQKISVNGNTIQENVFDTKFEITDIAKEGDLYHIQVAFRSQKATLSINGQTLDTTATPQLKAASEDLIGRKLTYVVNPDFTVKEVQGIEELQKSKAGQTFGAGLDEAMFKRTFERLLLARSDVDAPLNKGDGWKISEETSLDANTKFVMKSDVVLTDVDERELVFDISSETEIAVAGNQDISIETPKGTGKIVWNREAGLPSSITLDTAVKVINKLNPQSTVTLDIEYSSKTTLEPKGTHDAKAEKK